MRLLLCFALGVTPIAACAHPQAAVGIAGLEQYDARCPSEPPILSDEDLEAIAGDVAEASADGLAPLEREAIIREKVLYPLLGLNLQGRACSLYERTRAEGLLTLGRRYNEALETR